MVYIQEGHSEVYEDTGCQAAPRCLTCPLPQCRLDDPAGYQRWRRQRKDRERVATMTQERLTVEQAAERFGVTVRTVFRIRRRVREERDADFADFILTYNVAGGAGT